MRTRLLLPALALLCLVISFAAQALTFPTLTGRVVDEAGLLTQADRAALTDALAALEAKTTDQLVVVTLKSLQGTSIEDYGYQLGRAWGIGQRGKNNGALLIVAPNERSVRIEVGYGLEGTLTDAATKLVIEATILPRFKAGDFPGGIRRGTAAIIRLLTGEDAAALAQPGPGASAAIAAPQAEFPVGPAIAIALAAVVLLIICAAMGGAICGFILRMLFWMLIAGRGGSSNNRSSSGSSWSGGGGSFGGGGSSGRW